MTDTTQSTPLLPTGFEDLSSLASTWALPTEKERYAMRLSVDLPALRRFYEVIHPRMGAVMRHLSEYPADDLASLPLTTRTLYRLALSYFEASHPIELRWKGVDLDDAFPASRIIYQAPSCSEN